MVWLISCWLWWSPRSNLFRLGTSCDESLPMGRAIGFQSYAILLLNFKCKKACQLSCNLFCWEIFVLILVPSLKQMGLQYYAVWLLNFKCCLKDIMMSSDYVTGDVIMIRMQRPYSVICRSDGFVGSVVDECTLNNLFVERDLSPNYTLSLLILPLNFLN